MPDIARRRRWAPGPNAKLDPSHPLSQGLHAIICGTQMHITAPATRTLTPSVGAFGVGLTGATTSTSYSTTGFATGPWTHVVAYTPGASVASNIVDMANSPGHGTHDRTLYVSNAGNWTGYLFDGAGKYANSGVAAVTGKATVVILSCSGSTLDIWVDGTLGASTAVSNVGFGGFTTPTLVWGRAFSQVASPPGPSDTAAMTGTLHMGGVWRRVLSRPEMAQISSDPFCMFRDRG